MYRDNLKTKKTLNGTGVFSDVVIPPNKPIITLRGAIFTKENIKNINDIIQIGPKTYLGMSGQIDDKINHSCSPNSYIRVLSNQAILFSICQIKPNMEITYDYSVSCIDKSLSIECNCGAINCRKVITNFDSLPKNITDKYLKLNIVPFYVKRNIFKD